MTLATSIRVVLAISILAAATAAPASDASYDQMRIREERASATTKDTKSSSGCHCPCREGGGSSAGSAVRSPSATGIEATQRTTGWPDRPTTGINRR